MRKHRSFEDALTGQQPGRTSSADKASVQRSYSETVKTSASSANKQVVAKTATANQVGLPGRCCVSRFYLYRVLLCCNIIRWRARECHGVFAQLRTTV